MAAVARSRNGIARERRVWGRRRPRTTRHMTVRVTPNPSHKCRSKPRRVRRWASTTRTNPTNSEYDSELSDAGYETETERDGAFDDANYSDESVPTFLSSKMIPECDDVVRVAAFPTPPVVEKEEPTVAEWAVVTPLPDRWPKDRDDLFANNPAGAKTWDEVEAATMHRLVSYHAVRDTKRLPFLSWRAARAAPHTRARAHAPRCSPTLQLHSASPATHRYPKREW